MGKNWVPTMTSRPALGQRLYVASFFLQQTPHFTTLRHHNSATKTLIVKFFFDSESAHRALSHYAKKKIW